MKDAYYSIPIHENYPKYLKLFWKEEYYQYILLSNGFLPAVRVFTKVLTPPFKYLRSKGYLSVKYIDESLLLGETFEICFNNIRATVAPLRELGFKIHPEKSVLVPTQQTTFLAFMIDYVRMTIALNEERKQSIHLHALPEDPIKLSSNNQRPSANHRSNSVLIQSCSIWPNVLEPIGKMQTTVPG